MFKSITAKTLTIIACAAFVAGLLVLLTSIAPVAKADVNPGVSQTLLLKGDRLALRAKGAACSAQGWPHYEPDCQFDRRADAAIARPVRIIALR